MPDPQKPPHDGGAPETDEARGGDGFAVILSRIFAAGAGLMRDEAALAKAEVSRAAKDAALGLGQMLVAVILAFVALIVLAAAAVLGLVAVGVSPFVAALVVGFGLLLIALALVQMALRLLSPKNLTPRRTLDNLRRDMETLKALGRSDDRADHRED